MCSSHPLITSAFYPDSSYRPPYSDMHRKPTSIFQFSELADHLESIVLCKEQLLISGNFDIHVDNAVVSDAIKLIDLSQAARLCGRWLLDFKNYVPSHRGWGVVLPHMGYIGMRGCEGYGFQAVYSRIRYINQSVWV